MINDLQDLIDNFNEIRYDNNIYYQRFNTTVLYVSSIIKYCTNPYSIILDNKHNKIVGIIDITNKQIIRLTSNKNFDTMAKVAKLTLTKIYH